PATNSWSPISTNQAASSRRAHVSVWTGDRMIVALGSNRSSYQDFPFLSAAEYDPKTDTWTPLPGGPFSTSLATAVWTGSMMITWGGVHDNNSYLTSFQSGNRYSPDTKQWTPTGLTPTQGLTVYGQSPIVWTGTEMIAWSIGDGGLRNGAVGGGGRYDPM